MWCNKMRHCPQLFQVTPIIVSPNVWQMRCLKEAVKNARPLPMCPEIQAPGLHLRVWKPLDPAKTYLGSCFSSDNPLSVQQGVQITTFKHKHFNISKRLLKQPKGNVFFYGCFVCPVVGFVLSFPGVRLEWDWRPWKAERVELWPPVVQRILRTLVTLMIVGGVLIKAGRQSSQSLQKQSLACWRSVTTMSACLEHAHRNLTRIMQNRLRHTILLKNTLKPEEQVHRSKTRRASLTFLKAVAVLKAYDFCQKSEHLPCSAIASFKYTHRASACSSIGCTAAFSGTATSATSASCAHVSVSCACRTNPALLRVRILPQLLLSTHTLPLCTALHTGTNDTTREPQGARTPLWLEWHPSPQPVPWSGDDSSHSSITENEAWGRMALTILKTSLQQKQHKLTSCQSQDLDLLLHLALQRFSVTFSGLTAHTGACGDSQHISRFNEAP